MKKTEVSPSPCVVSLCGGLLLGGLLVGVLPALAQQTQTTNRPVAAPSAGTSSGSNRSGRATTPVSAPRAVPSVAIENVKVAAIVSGEEIPMSDVNRLVQSVVQDHPALAADTPEAKANLKKVRDDVLENMISQRLLVQEAQRRNLMPTKEKIDEAVWDFKKGFNTPADFNKWLADEGKTEQDLRDLLSRRLASETLKKTLVADVAVTDVDIQKYYEDNKAEFVIPESVWVRHIQLSFPKNATEKQKDELRKKAQDVLKKAVYANANFAELAKDHSDDKVSATRGGDLGVLVRDDILDPAFAEAVFNTPIGKVNSKLIETKHGFNIVKVDRKKPSRTMALTEVQQYIKPLLLQQRAKERLDNQLAQLRSKANVKKNI